MTPIHDMGVPVGEVWEEWKAWKAATGAPCSAGCFVYTSDGPEYHCCLPKGHLGDHVGMLETSGVVGQRWHNPDGYSHLILKGGL